METTTDHPRVTTDHAGDNPARRPITVFAAVALPSGWLLLGIPVALGLPDAPFVLATLLLGLVLPAVVLTRHDPNASMRALLRDTARIPRAGVVLVPALVVIPGLTWVAAYLTGNAPPLDSELLVSALINVASSVIIVNLWEEMAWQGFFQRRVSARWGFVGGAMVTASMFVGVHVALAFSGADNATDVRSGFVALVVAGIGLRLLLGALDRWSGRSILTVAVAHASFNVASDFVHAEADWIRYAVTLALGLAFLTAVIATAAARRQDGGR